MLSEINANVHKNTFAHPTCFTTSQVGGQGVFIAHHFIKTENDSQMPSEINGGQTKTRLPTLPG